MEPTTAEPTFADQGAINPRWEHVAELLRTAELYWLTTVRPDGRPHVTPVVGVWHDDTLCFTTGAGERKHDNLQGNGRVAVTTGANTWASGTDVVVEGRAERVTGLARTRPYAQAFGEKYGSDWDWRPTEDGFAWADDPKMAPEVFAVVPTKVLVFAKRPHGQTVFRP